MLHFLSLSSSSLLVWLEMLQEPRLFYQAVGHVLCPLLCISALKVNILSALTVWKVQFDFSTGTPKTVRNGRHVGYVDEGTGRYKTVTDGHKQ